MRARRRSATSTWSPTRSTTGSPTTGRHTCLGALPGARERTVVLGGFSKAHAMTGWRVGWICAPEAVARAVRAGAPVHDAVRPARLPARRGRGAASTPTTTSPRWSPTTTAGGGCSSRGCASSASTARSRRGPSTRSRRSAAPAWTPRRSPSGCCTSTRSRSCPATCSGRPARATCGARTPPRCRCWRRRWSGWGGSCASLSLIAAESTAFVTAMLRARIDTPIRGGPGGQAACVLRHPRPMDAHTHHRRATDRAAARAAAGTAPPTATAARLEQRARAGRDGHLHLPGLHPRRHRADRGRAARALTPPQPRRLT